MVIEAMMERLSPIPLWIDTDPSGLVWTGLDCDDDLAVLVSSFGTGTTWNFGFVRHFHLWWRRSFATHVTGYPSLIGLCRLCQ
jgi:hypothetical protein